ncbi:MAG: hypothetical protein RMA76_39165 [Deltaproteobacteria bacterium]
MLPDVRDIRSLALVALLLAACGSVEPQPRRITVQIVGDGAGTVSSNVGGLDCPDVCSIDVESGATLTLEAEAAVGSAFVGFDVAACGSDASCAFEVTGARTVTARFELRRARLSVVRAGDGGGTVTSAPAGIDCGATCSAELPIGTSVTLTATPEANARFGSWSAPCADATGDCVFALNEDTEVRATFDDRFATLGVVFAGSGTGEVRDDGDLVCTSTTAQCEASYEVGTRVTLTATPGPATTFVGWSDSDVCSGRQPCTLPLQRSQSVTATFEGITHALTVSRSGPGRGAVVSANGAIDCGAACTADFAAGATIELTATPNRHYRFVRWTGACAGAAPTCEITMDTAKSVDAELEFTPKLATGFRHACATSTDGRLRCWGANDFGQLGYGHVFDVGATPTRTAMTEGDVPIDVPVESVALGFDHTCVLLVGGAVRCWGRGSEGQLGYGDAMSRGGQLDSLPRLLDDVSLSGLAVEVTAGSEHSCVLLADRNVQCWGANTRGALGYGEIDYVGREAGSIPSAAGFVPMGQPVQQLVSGSRFNCALLADSTLRCWGGNQSGQLGYGDRDNRGDDTNETPGQLPPVPVGAPVAYVTANNGAHVCAALVGGDLKCWGLGIEGRLGYGNNNDVGADATVPSTLGGVQIGWNDYDVLAGGAHTCARSSAGALRCWGWNSTGQLGYGDAANRGDTPATIPASTLAVDVGRGVIEVRPGGTFTCARVVGGNVLCWGENNRGQLGLGDTMTRGHTAGTVPSMLPAVAIF